MKYESIKTTLLIILVLTSIVLTWSLWTYQPQYDLQGTDDLVEEVTTNNSKEITKIIKPIHVLYHISGQHFGTHRETELNRVMKEIRPWEVNDVQNITHVVQDQGLADFLSQDGHVEIYFPDSFPLQLYKSFININDKDHGSNTFDRFVIDVNSQDQGEGNVYFVSTGENLVYEGRVDSRFISEFRRGFFTTATRYPEQVEYELTDSNSIFLPKDPLVVKRLDNYFEEIEINTFIDRLFTNRVKKDELTTGEVHTDGTRMLRTYHNERYIEFINPTRISENETTTTDLIQTSIDFVNEHTGWTDNYRFFSWNKQNQTTMFKLYFENIPVFSRRGLTDITQQWENNDIARYFHPAISLRFPLNAIEVSLPMGEKVMKEIKSIRNFNPELLEYVTVAYEMRENEANPQLVSLQPIWTYKYNGKWLKVEIKDEVDIGGDSDGLE